jgi:hypothetical protein
MLNREQFVEITGCALTEEHFHRHPNLLEFQNCLNQIKF